MSTIRITRWQFIFLYAFILGSILAMYNFCEYSLDTVEVYGMIMTEVACSFMLIKGRCNDIGQNSIKYMIFCLVITAQCHLVKQMAEEEYLREKMIYRKESHLLFFAVRQKDRWTSASK